LVINVNGNDVSMFRNEIFILVFDFDTECHEVMMFYNDVH